MLSKATYAGRICLSCRTQLRASRRFPSTAAHRSNAPLSSASARSAYYSTKADDNGDESSRHASMPWDDIEVPASKNSSDSPLADRLKALGDSESGGLGWSDFERLTNPPPPEPKASKARKGSKALKAPKKATKTTKAAKSKATTADSKAQSEAAVEDPFEALFRPADTEAHKSDRPVKNRKSAGDAFESLFHGPSAEAPKSGRPVKSQEAAGDAFEGLFYGPGAEAPKSDRSMASQEAAGDTVKGLFHSPNAKALGGDKGALKGELFERGEHEVQAPHRPLRKREPWPTERRRSGHSVDTPSLGMDILGRPGHTIVIRDHRNPQNKPEVLAEEETMWAPAASGRDIEETLAEQRTDVEAEELRRNIEELRPGSAGDTVLVREFQDTLRTLMEGFTVQQLKEYVADMWAGVEGGAPMGLEAAPWRQRTIHRLTKELHTTYRVASKYSWIEKQFSWVPPVDYPWGATTKERLAVAILRECWGLQVMEEVPYIGELNLVTKPWMVNLFLTEERTLKDIKKSLGEDIDIRVSPETSEIKIVATRTKCNTALEHLDRFVQEIKHVDVRWNKDIGVNMLRFTDDDLRYLGTLTNTYIDLVSRKDVPDSNTPLRISWHEGGSRPQGVELPSQIVPRLLRAEKKQSDSNRYVWLIMDGSHTLKRKDLALVRHHGDFHELPWYCRHSIWSQLAYTRPPKLDDSPAKVDTPPTPPPKSSPWEEFLAASGEGTETEMEPPVAVTSSNGPVRPTVPMDIPLAALELPILRWHQSPRTADGWMPLAQRTTATFGHLLHPASPGHQLEPLVRHTLIDNPGVFMPASPPLASLTSLGVPKRPDSAEASPDTPQHPPPPQQQPLTKLILHFDPFNKTSPPLELALHLTPEQQTSGPLTWDATEKHLYALPKTANSTALIPTCPVDIDLRQATVAEMRPEALEALAPLRDFFDTSVLDLSSGTLLTPETLGPLPIPVDFGPQKTETRDTRYRFAGLELHTQASIPFHGHTLTYTAVEAGHHGGRAGHLALEAVPTYDPESGLRVHEANERLVNSFLGETLRVASGRYFPWVGSRPVEAAAAAVDDMAS